MRRKSAWKLVAVAFCALLVLLSVSSVALSASHLPHECYVEQCVVCAIIVSTTRGLRALALFALLTGLPMGYAATRLISRDDAPFSFPDTPISLKVRMNP